MTQHDAVASYQYHSYESKRENTIIRTSFISLQVKMLEEKNTDYMQRNMELEEDVKKTGNWRPQIDAYKKQASGFQNGYVKISHKESTKLNPPKLKKPSISDRRAAREARLGDEEVRPPGVRHEEDAGKGRGAVRGEGPAPEREGGIQVSAMQLHWFKNGMHM